MKSMFAMLALVCTFVLSTASGSAPAKAAPAAPQIGACRWTCGASPTQFKTAAACAAVCSVECDSVC